MTGNLVSLQKKIKRLDSHVEQDFLKQKVFDSYSKINTPRIDVLEREMKRLSEENVKTDVEIGEIQG